MKAKIKGKQYARPFIDEKAWVLYAGWARLICYPVTEKYLLSGYLKGVKHG